MNLWLYSLRDMARRPGRSLLTLMSIVLGVGTVFAVSATIAGAQAAYSRLTETLSGKAEAQVVARGGGRFAREQVAFVEQSPQVQLAVPLLNQTAVLHTDNKKKVQINGVGTLIAREKLLHPFDLLSGRLLENEGEIMLEESLAQSADIKVGDDLKIVTRRSFARGFDHVTVVGLFRPTEVWAFAQGGLAYLDLADWQYMSKAEGKIDSLQIALVPGADKAKVFDAIAAQLPKDLQLRRSDDDQASSNVTLIAFQYGLEATRSLALVVAALLILNTFQMNVTERSGQIAVLRLIGATRSQVMRLFLREGALVGVIGAVIGLPVGWLLARWLSRGVENAFAVKLQRAELELGSFLFAFAMGPAVAVVAAFWAARRAARIGPLEGLRQRSSARPEKLGWRHIAIGSVLCGLSSIGMILSWAQVLPREFALSVAILFLIGLLLMFPLVLRPAYSLVYHLLRFLGPMEFELACRQMVRTEGRALLTWGILFMAVTTSAATGLILTDVIDDIRADVRRTTLSDFIIRVTSINLATGASAKLPEGVGPVVRQMEGVASVENMAIVSMEVPEAGRALAVVREFELYERVPLELPEANLADVRRKILEGEIVLSDILSYRIGKKVGDLVEVTFGGKTGTFRVAATAPFFLAGGMAFFIDHKTAEKTFGALETDALLINAKPAQRDALAEQLRALCQDRGLLFQTYADVQERLGGILNTVVASLWILLALGFLIAVFGVTNTIMMNILEQTREIGLMRVLGMQRRQIRRMILAQSAYVGLLAIIPGLAAGVILAYVIRSSSLAILGEYPHFGELLPWLGPYALGLLLLVLLYGWLPAARAARLNILESIRSE